MFEIPFNSKRKFHLVITKIRDVDSTQSQYLMMLKGAPEIIIERCTLILSCEGQIELNINEKQEFQVHFLIFK